MYVKLIYHLSKMDLQKPSEWHFQCEIFQDATRGSGEFSLSSLIFAAFSKKYAWTASGEVISYLTNLLYSSLDLMVKSAKFSS